jgi:hypothetical protein
MKITEMFPRRYATGEDLQGKSHTLIIDRVTSEQLHPTPGAPAQTKYVIYFRSTKKGVILSRPLALQIAEIAGDETNSWPGVSVAIYPQPMTVAGKAVIAIRARKPTNGVSQPPATLTQDDDDEI